MRWILLPVFAALAPICLAEAPEIPGCGRDSAVACFVDHAQDRLRSCWKSSNLPSGAAGTDSLSGRPKKDDRQRQDCVAASHREIDPLYREALNAARNQRGTTRAVMDYYEDWNRVLDGRAASGAAAAGDSGRSDMERLNVKAEHLRQGR